MKSENNYSGETPKSFFSTNAPDGGKYECYVKLFSNRPADEVACCLSQTIGVNLDKVDHFDECEAYLAVLGNHDLTVYPPQEGNNIDHFDIMVEPGHTCLAVGNSIDLSVEFAAWLNLKAAVLGRFTVLEDK